MRFAIYGSGGLGGYYGARLAEAGHTVGFIARGEHLAAISANGLQVFSPSGDFHLVDPVASDDPQKIAGALGAVDVVVVAVKTWQVPEIAKNIVPLMSEQTIVVPFLNGVEAADQLIDVLGPGSVIGGLSKVFSLVEKPGVIRHLNPNAYIEVGELDGKPSVRVQALVDAFIGVGVDAIESPDIRTALWKKLMLVASWAGLATLARNPIGVLRANPETRAMIDASIDEGLAVGRARGYTLIDSLKAEIWSFYDSLPEDTTASMMRDMLEQKPSELDAWVGAIVKAGVQLGVPVPVSGFVYHTLAIMENQVRSKV